MTIPPASIETASPHAFPRSLNGKDNRRLVKELEKAKKRFVAKLKERADREGKDNTLTFEELGV